MKIYELLLQEPVTITTRLYTINKETKVKKYITHTETSKTFHFSTYKNLLAFVKMYDAKKLVKSIQTHIM